MTVTDFRARPNTSEYMAAYPPDYDFFDLVPGHDHPGTDTLEAFVSALDDVGVDRAVFTGRQTVEDGRVVRGVTNDYVADCVDRYPDRLVGFAGVDCETDVVAATRELERAVRDLDLSGVSFDPTSPDARTNYPLYAKAAELDVPVVLTLGPNVGTVGDSHDAARVDRVATDFPDLTFVCSHAAWPRPTEFVALAYRRPNVYIDGSIYQFFPGAEPFVAAAEDLIREKVLYASAFPFDSLDAIERFRALPLSDAATEAIVSENASRLLDD
ncbi:amidohydrolase family protein [Halomarina oriensis]|uniref:Amidohydrolase family protein n=1 Tax=Halomarina oriensis TaxID=671145 RepID=A0A6B0GMQ1_9EURY|nr:amidohydrolase family protein [Halomarina oriensis]MWG33405.1 amidohydrolase family protein [Halomarina oriensis]